MFCCDSSRFARSDGSLFGLYIRRGSNYSAAGDSISVSGTTFDSATWRRGALDLFNGTTLVGTLKLAGNYAGDTFSVTNDVITVETGSGTSAAAEKEASATPRSLQLFTQAMASFERQSSALHDFSAGVAQQAVHPMLAAAR